jgi:hypothetical protein
MVLLRDHSAAVAKGDRGTMVATEVLIAVYPAPAADGQNATRRGWTRSGKTELA